MDISAIVCSHNRRDQLLHCLKSLAAMDVPHSLAWEVLVVDNNSSDGTRDAVARHLERGPSNFRYTFEPRQGKSFALNRGIDETSGRVLAFTDDDVTVGPRWLASFAETFAAFACAGAGGRVVAEWLCERPDWLAPGEMSRFLSVIPEFDFGDAPRPLATQPFGGNMAYARATFATYGRFRTDLGVRTAAGFIGGEDSEFGQRLLRAGETMMYAPDAVVHHPVDPARVRKEFFVKWYFDHGRARVRSDSIPEGAVWYAGVPRYLIREMAEGVARWMFARGSRERLHARLHCHLVAGEIAEARDIARRERRGAATGR